MLFGLSDVCSEPLLLYFRVGGLMNVLLHSLAHVRKDFVVGDRDFIVREVGKAILFPFGFPAFSFSLFGCYLLVSEYLIFNGDFLPSSLAFKALHDIRHRFLILHFLVNSIDFGDIFLLLAAVLLIDINHKVLVNNVILFLFLRLEHSFVVILLNHLSHGLIFPHNYLRPRS